MRATMQKPEDDIVHRLRFVMLTSLNDAIRTMEDAAQEIERLRAPPAYLAEECAKIAEGFVSVELLNIERATADRLRDDNASLRAQLVSAQEVLRRVSDIPYFKNPQIEAIVRDARTALTSAKRDHD